MPTSPHIDAARDAGQILDSPHTYLIDCSPEDMTHYLRLIRAYGHAATLSGNTIEIDADPERMAHITGRKWKERSRTSQKTGRKWIIRIFNEAGGLREQIVGEFDLDEAFALVHREWIVDSKPALNKGPWWTIQMNKLGLPEFYAFSVPSRPMSDAEFQAWKDSNRIKARSTERPSTSNFEALERDYALPHGRISAIHIQI